MGVEESAVVVLGVLGTPGLMGAPCMPGVRSGVCAAVTVVVDVTVAPCPCEWLMVVGDASARGEGACVRVMSWDVKSVA